MKTGIGTCWYGVPSVCIRGRTGRRVWFAWASPVEDEYLAVPFPPWSGVRTALGVVNVDDEQCCTFRRLKLTLVHPLPLRGRVVGA